jgi:GH3 auxin-responsive promoter
MLRSHLECNARSAFGRTHAFETVRSYEEFTRRVPLADYDSLGPWIERIRHGETNVLTRERVTHLVPTSGSTSARKLIPFTAGLHREFNAALGAWLIDLQRKVRGLMGGPAYWSVTPAVRSSTTEESVVPIGFDSDTAYLGGPRRRLAEAVMAVPSGVQRAGSLEEFRRKTLLHLLRCRDLRLISVWHPSFLALLLDSLPDCWDELIAEIADGSTNWAAAPRRAAELRSADPCRPESIWPALRLISCWGDGVAELGAADLRRRFPKVLFQPKGLLATEAVVTLPFNDLHPLAITSHFFEFIDDAGRVLPVEAVSEGHEYEIVVTTAGGLWRYRLGDRVLVTTWLEKTPSLKFLGRTGNISDRFGEKLSEPFVADALNRVFGSLPPRFALLAPDEDDKGCRYTLYVEGQTQPHWAESLDRELRDNPHYAYCRDLGQLLPVGLFVIAEKGFETFARRQAAEGARLGDIKPAALCQTSGWSTIFLEAAPDTRLLPKRMGRE